MINLDSVRTLQVQDSDLLVVPLDTGDDDVAQLVEALRHLVPDRKVIIVRGALEHLDKATLNELGGYRA